MSRQVADTTKSEGESWIFDATLVADDGSILDISTATEIEWGVSPTLATIPPPLAKATLTDDQIRILTDGKDGKVRVRLDPADHAAVSPGDYVQMCRVITSGGIVVEQFWGNWKVTQSIFV